MTRLPIAVVGDTTTGGGSILEGESWFLIDGKPAACLGARVLCGTCGPTVISTASDLTFVGDKPLARHGDALACGHRIVAGKQQLADEGSSGAAASRGSPKPLAGKTVPIPASPAHAPATSVRSPPDARQPTAHALSIRWLDAKGNPHCGLGYAKCIEGQPAIRGKADQTASSAPIRHPDRVRVAVSHSPPPVEID